MGKIFFSHPRPQWERVGVRVVLGCLWLIAGLSFGQEGLFKTETKPSLIYGYGFHSQPLQTNFQVRPLSFYSSYKRPLLNSFIANALIMQAEGDSLQPKTSFWKQAGIYGLEVVGGEVGTALAILFAAATQISAKDPGDINQTTYISTYFILATLFTGSGVWGTGNLLGQKLSWRNSIIGAAIGSTIAVTSVWLTGSFKNAANAERYSAISIGVCLFAPSVFSTVCCNLK